MHFLSLNPSAENPFPTFWVSRRYESKCSATTDPESFWNMITKDNLRAHGLSDPKVMQTKLVAERLVAITKTAQASNPAADVRAWVSAVRRLSVGSLEEDVMSQVNVVSLLVFQDGTPEEILLAVEKTSDNSNLIASSLVTFPRGRQLVDDAKNYANTELSDARKTRR